MVAPASILHVLRFLREAKISLDRLRYRAYNSNGNYHSSLKGYGCGSTRDLCGSMVLPRIFEYEERAGFEPARGLVEPLGGPKPPALSHYATSPFGRRVGESNPPRQEACLRFQFGHITSLSTRRLFISFSFQKPQSSVMRNKLALLAAIQNPTHESISIVLAYPTCFFSNFLRAHWLFPRCENLRNDFLGLSSLRAPLAGLSNRRDGSLNFLPLQFSINLRNRFLQTGLLSFSQLKHSFQHLSIHLSCHLLSVNSLAQIIGPHSLQIITYTGTFVKLFITENSEKIKRSNLRLSCCAIYKYQGLSTLRLS